MVYVIVGIVSAIILLISVYELGRYMSHEASSTKMITARDIIEVIEKKEKETNDSKNR